MGVVKNQKKSKTKNDAPKTEVVNGKPKKDESKVKKKKKVSCLQCIKSHDDGGIEGKYRVAAPELMQDTFMSDSEDEGGEVECPIQQQQQYRYMNTEVGTLHRAKPLEDSVTDGHLWPSNNDKKVATIERQPVDIGFLVSFVVDARGGAMKAKRRGGVRIIVPPAACAAPTRVTCRAATRRAPAAAPPPLMEGEALASRLLELQPQGAKFLAPVIIEVPIFTASCREREIVVLRSDTGETWQDHYLHNNDNPLIQEALARERQEHGPSCETLGESGERVTRVVTCDFPHYLAVVSRVRQEVHVIGPEGGTVSSAHIPQVQALFPPQALTKRIRVGLQAHGAAPELARRVLPRHAAVSPVLTVEPRRRKFHRSITLTVPLPAHQGHDKQSTSTLRLLCSIMGGQARAVWEDVTGSTPLTLTEDCASFTTTVSARFWLMNCQNVSDATKLATELYREMLLVPFEVRIVVLGKRLDALEGRLLVLYITDRYAYDTLLQQEHYTEIAHSTAVRFLDGKEVYLEFSGNLVPVTKSGSQPMFTFEAFKDNRVEFTVRVKHHEENPSGRVYFMNEPKVAKGEQSQTPACVLDVELPERIAPRAAKSQMDYLNLDQSGFDALKDELSFHWGDHNNSLGPASLPNQDHHVNGHHKIISNGDVKYPTKDTEDKDTKPQVNGGTVHVDSNKTKATFDSDEDKTPMNTLEKGKKKPEGGSFFGGIADKVKNVFGHSEDSNEDVKESSPKPQPKPRESKDKSPPKPAPRLITEDLLEKVDDMFKDIKRKPHSKDEDELDSHVYSTKLIVDEESDRPSGLHDITEEVYKQYENMQPVETPLRCKTSDPFQFYTGCCEGKYRKDQMHRHDETSNLVDRIEQINFTVHEKLDEIPDKVHNDFKDGLDKLENEKDHLKQKSNEFTNDLKEKADDLKNNLKNESNYWTSTIEEKSNASEKALKDQLNKLNEDAIEKKDKIQSKIEAEIENTKSSAKDTLSELAETTNLAKSKLENKAVELDFAARERAEELRLRGLDQMHALDEHVNNARDSVNQKSNEVSQSVNNLKENLNHKAQDVKSNLEDKVEHVKDTTNKKINDVNESLNNVKDKTQKAAVDLKSKADEKKDQVETEVKKKKKEGKNFFTGLVHNIFGEKDKIENEIKEKVSETEDFTDKLVKQASEKKDDINDKLVKGRESVEKIAQEQTDKVKERISQTKESADELLKNASSKKVAIEESIEKKKEELDDDIDRLVQKGEEKKTEVQQAIKDKKDEAVKAVVDKTDEVKQAANIKKEAVVKIVEDNIDNLRHTKDEVQSEARNELEKIWQEAIQTTEEIKKSGGMLVDGASNKAANIQNDVTEKYDEINNATSEKINDLKESSKQTVDDLQNTTLSAFEKIEGAAKDKSNSAKEAWEDLQSSTRDTYADMRDDVTSLESSAQDTLHSFQSSAGNTFDSLDESVKEYVSGAQNTVQNVESQSKELFGEMKNSFEGFQISADNKLEDVKAATNEGLENAGAALDDTKVAMKNDLKGAEESVVSSVTSGADKLASGIDAIGSYTFGASDQGAKKESTTKLLESEKAQSSPHKKSSGFFSKLRRNP